MIKQTLMAAAIAGTAALGMAGAAHAHDAGYKHKHTRVGPVTVEKRKKFRRNQDREFFRAKKRGDYTRRYADYGPKHRNRHYGPNYRNKRHYGPAWGWGGLPPYVIRQTLRARGYRRIKFRDRTLPLYVVKACKRGNRFLVGLNRWGGVVWREHRGYCGPRNHYY